MTDKLPDNGGYVAAAYIVFLLLLLVYFAVMAMRAGRIERELGEVLDLVQAERSPDAPPSPGGHAEPEPQPAATGGGEA